MQRVQLVLVQKQKFQVEKVLLHCIVHQQNCTNIFSNKLSKVKIRRILINQKSLQQLNDYKYNKNYLFLRQNTKSLL